MHSVQPVPGSTPCITGTPSSSHQDLLPPSCLPPLESGWATEAEMAQGATRPLAQGPQTGEGLSCKEMVTSEKAM